MLNRQQINPASKQKQILLQAATTGAAAAIFMRYFMGDVSTVNYFGANVSAPVAIGLACGVGSAASDLFSEQIINELKLSQQVINGSNLLIELGVCGAASAGVLYFGGNLPTESLLYAASVGAGSKLAGNYANQMLFDAKTGVIGPIF